jgi:hypothetical protein
MGSSSLLSKVLRIVLTGVVSFQIAQPVLFAEIPRPFPVLGTVAVVGGHWNDTPELIENLLKKLFCSSHRF